MSGAIASGRINRRRSLARVLEGVAMSLRYARYLTAVVLVPGGAPVAVHPATAATAATVFVSPSGNDANPGTSGQPVRTLHLARDLVVSLADGTYQLTQPLTLDARDSGSGGHRIIWTAAPGARPVISGGTRITGWKRG